jgi:hypothetical protein
MKNVHQQSKLEPDSNWVPPNASLRMLHLSPRILMKNIFFQMEQVIRKIKLFEYLGIKS